MWIYNFTLMLINLNLVLALSKSIRGRLVDKILMGLGLLVSGDEVYDSWGLGLNVVDVVCFDRW